MIIKAKKLLLYPFILFLGSGIFLSSCGDKTKLTAEQASKNLIAKNQPEAVFAISAQDLLDKSGMSNGSVFPAGFKMLFAEMVEYVTNSDKTGIDFKGRSFFMTKMTEEGKLNHVSLVFNLKDAEAFSKMIKEDLEVEPAEKEGYHFVLSPDNDFGISWYKQFGIVVFLSGEEDRGKEALEKLVSEHMTSSIVEGELPSKYKELFDEKADFAALYSLDGFVNMAAAGNKEADEASKKLKELYADSYSYYSVNFETDKIKGKLVNHLSDKAQSTFTEMLGKGVSPDMMNFLTDDKLFGFFTVALASNPVYNFMKEMGGEEFSNEVDNFKKETGLEITDVIGSFTGEMAMAFVGMEEKVSTYTYVDEDGKEAEESYTSQSPIITAVIGIKGELIKNILDTAGNVEKTDGVFKMGNDLYVALTPTKLFFSSKESLAREVATKGSLKTFSANGIEKKAFEKSGFGYFDFKPLVTSLSGNEKEIQQMLANYDYAQVYGDMNQLEFELNFRNTGENGLYIITKAVMDTYFSIAF